MIDGDDKTDVYTASAYRSGGSKVITVSGIPILCSGEDVNMIEASLGDNDVVVCAKYNEMPKHEMEKMNPMLEHQGSDEANVLGDFATMQGLIDFLNDEHVRLGDDEKLKLVKES